MKVRGIRHLSYLAILAATLMVGRSEALAQGCIAIRNNEPLFGDGSTLPRFQKEWQLYVSYRDATADQHYSGTVYNPQRQSLGTNVVNKQRIVDLSASYSFTPRLSLVFSVPYVQASWSLPTPFPSSTQPTPGPRTQQDASGIGDISASGRLWILDPLKHTRGNWSVGLGVKAPTGEHDAKDTYPVFNGTNPTNKAVDQSIQPGDGGWGALVSLQGYHKIGVTTLFGSGSYLINPRDTNGTPSIATGLGFPSAALGVNSVPDQYLLRTGVSFPLWKQQLSMSIAFRMEGVPRYDLIGDSHGFRRPGYETFAEPGVTYNFGSSSISVYVPIGLIRDRQPNPYTGAAGDATFPSATFLAGYTYRFANPSAAPVDTSR